MTNYTDLVKSNKRVRDQVDTEDEEMMDDRDPPGDPLPDQNQDTWESTDDGKIWTRIHNTPRRRLYVPLLTENVPVHLFKPGRITVVRRGSPNPDRIRI